MYRIICRHWHTISAFTRFIMRRFFESFSLAYDISDNFVYSTHTQACALKKKHFLYTVQAWASRPSARARTPKDVCSFAMCVCVAPSFEKIIQIYYFQYMKIYTRKIHIREHMQIIYKKNVSFITLFAQNKLTTALSGGHINYKMTCKWRMPPRSHIEICSCSNISSHNIASSRMQLR